MKYEMTIVVFENDGHGKCKSMDVEITLTCKCKWSVTNFLEMRTDS